MKTPLVRKFQYIILIVFITIVIIATYTMFRLANESKDNWIHNKYTNSTIVEIYGGYNGKPNYQIMKLADSQTFAIPNVMLYKIKVGDSVHKQKDSSFYVFTLKNIKAKCKADWQ
jgi:hypothetical protein